MLKRLLKIQFFTQYHHGQKTEQILWLMSHDTQNNTLPRHDSDSFFNIIFNDFLLKKLIFTEQNNKFLNFFPKKIVEIFLTLDKTLGLKNCFCSLNTCSNWRNPKLKTHCKSHGRPTPTGGDQLRAGQLRFGAAASADAVLLRLKLSFSSEKSRRTKIFLKTAGESQISRLRCLKGTWWLGVTNGLLLAFLKTD